MIRRVTMTVAFLLLIPLWKTMTISESLSPRSVLVFALKGEAVNLHSNDRYDSLFQFYAGDLDWRLLKAQAKAESNFNPDAVSPVGAKGLTQFMPGTWAEVGHGLPSNPEESIKAQVQYMKDQIRRFGSEKLALAAYNCGPGRLRSLLAKYGPTYEMIEPKLPQETRDYVAKILDFWQDYSA